MVYLVDNDGDFIPEVKEFLDWKGATRKAPSTIESYGRRLLWYYRYLYQRQIGALDARPVDLTEFVIWLCNPMREAANVTVIHQESPFQASTVNLILHAVGALYRHLVRLGQLKESPVLYEDVPRGRWLKDRDLLAHTRRGKGSVSVQRMALKLREPKQLPKTVTPNEFDRFLLSMPFVRLPQSKPSSFRDRLMCLVLKEGGFRLGELLGMRLEDLDFPGNGIHVRFRANNQNGARAKAGYGRDRFVHLPREVMGVLDIYLTEIWVEAEATTDFLWLSLKQEARDWNGRSTFGAPLGKSAVEKMFGYYSRKSEVKIHPHMLRHTHATDLVRSFLDQGKQVDWKFIQERLGHSSVVTTMMTYTHYNDEDRRKAYELYLQRKEHAHGR